MAAVQIAISSGNKSKTLEITDKAGDILIGGGHQERVNRVAEWVEQQFTMVVRRELREELVSDFVDDNLE